MQSPTQMDAATEALESRAEAISNVTYTAPNESGEAESTVDPATVAATPQGVRVGLNDPCPCGSGKKYKQCHGKLA